MQIVKQPWAVPIEELFLSLESNQNGLLDEEVEIRLKKFGNNSFHSKEKKNIIFIFFKQFASPLIFLLIGSVLVTVFLKSWIDAIVISFAVLLNVLLGFYHEYHAENTLDKLKTYIKDRARVIRGGREQEIDSSLIVPGDIIKLSYGSRVPADARILTINNLRVDEAILTGESLPVEKRIEEIHLTTGIPERYNMVHAGTLIVEGYATAIVCATSNDTEIGKIAGIVSGIERSETPLQKGVSRLAWFIFLIVIFVVIGIFALGIMRGEAVLSMLILSSAVAVGAVPEALPIVLTMILAIGSTRIADKKGIIRKLSAAETLGSSTLIMTDKTGTLTLADMQLVGIYTKDTILSLNTGAIENKSFSQDQKKLLEYSLLNIDVSVENLNLPKSEWVFKGRPFEINIAKACRLHDVSLDNIAYNNTALILPFNSTNKFSISENNTHYIVMGAPDILLKKSNMTKEEYILFEEWINNTSKEGKRLIGLASFPKKHNKKHFKIEDVLDLTFLGMLVFFDPIRPEVPNAIKNIEMHGIKMVLVTGDLPGTAISVAKSLDWEVSEDQVLTGSDLKSISDDELIKIISRIKIFARVTPEDKLRIGLLYKKTGEIVAMTGDGVNDAPALKAMDIGISLGSSSDVAKSVADLVLLDDNFETISMAIDEGRKILGNVRKAFVYLMSNSLDEVFVVGGSLIMGLALPLTALQIIWVNLFTGSLPALAFAYEKDMDKEKYLGHDLKLIFTKEVKILTFVIGVVSSTFLFLLYYFLLRLNLPIETVRSIFFVCFSSYILGISFSFRSLHLSIFSYSIFANKKLNLSILLALIILIITMAVPSIRGIFDLGALPLSWLPFIAFWILFNVFLVEMAKYVMRRKV